MIIVMSSFRKPSLPKCFRPHVNAKRVFSNVSALKSVFVKLCFRGGLVWTVGLTVEKKFHLEISPASCGRDFRFRIHSSWLEEERDRAKSVLLVQICVTYGEYVSDND